MTLCRDRVAGSNWVISVVGSGDWWCLVKKKEVG
jgi:hypothetical protein